MRTFSSLLAMTVAALAGCQASVSKGAPATDGARLRPGFDAWQRPATTKTDEMRGPELLDDPQPSEGRRVDDPQLLPRELDVAVHGITNDDDGGSPHDHGGSLVSGWWR